MKARLIVLLLLASFLVPVEAHALLGTLSDANIVRVSGNLFYLEVTATCGGTGLFSRRELSKAINGWIVAIETDPGTPAPTDNWSLYLYNVNGADILNAAGENRDEAVTELTRPYIDDVTDPVPNIGALDIQITGNAVAAASITVRIFYVKP